MQIDGATLAVLNCYRNKYYAEGNDTEQGIVANSINDVLPILVDYKENGYTKQSEGEWKRIEVNGKNYGQVYYQHKDCKVNETEIFRSPYHFCPNCGVKMKGGTE